MQVKKTVGEIEPENAVRIVDDTIQENPWTDLICWHFDPYQNRTGPEPDEDLVLQRRSLDSSGLQGDLQAATVLRLGDVADQAGEVMKNPLLQEMFRQGLRNPLKFRYSLRDSWFAAKDNFELILAQGKHFVAVLKDNRLVALSEADKPQGRFVRVDSLQLADKQVGRGWLKGFEHEVFRVGRVFTNQDGRTGRLNRVDSTLTCDGERVADLHSKRWKVEIS